MSRRSPHTFRPFSTAAESAAVGGALAAVLVPFARVAAQGPFGALEAAGACADLSENICSRANTTFLAMCGGYVVAALLLCVPWTVVWSGRGARGATTKLLVPLIVGALLAGLGVALDPFASENYLCCAADPAFRATLLLGESPPARGIVLGAAPFVVLYVIVVAIVKAVRR